MPAQGICQCRDSPFAQSPFVNLSICESTGKHHISPHRFYISAAPERRRNNAGP